jgi:cytochrome P450
VPRRFPPGPTNFNAWCGFTWRHAWRQLADPLNFVTELAESYGDIAFYRLFIYEAYQLNHPDLVRDVLVTKAASFRKQPRQRELIERIAGPGILTTDGEAWVRKRRMMLPAFQGEIGRQMASTAVREIHRWADARREGETINLYETMTDLMLRTVGGSFFRLETADETRELAAALHALADCFLDRDYFLVRLSGWLPQLNRRRQRDAEGVIARYFTRAIEARREIAAERSDDRDLLSLLLAAVDDGGDGQRMTEQEVLAEARTMFFAGHHTAASCLTFTLHLLAQHSDIRRRLLEEIGDELQNRPPTVADIPRLTYTTQVLQESMRLYPPAWALFAREAIQPVEIGDYTLPKGAWVFMYPWVLHRDARFFPDPLRFDPERFAPANSEQIPTGAYIPFGLGSHSCIGGRIAMMTLQVALPAILQRFNFNEVPGQLPLELHTAISLRPKRELRMRLEQTPPAARS